MTQNEMMCFKYTVQARSTEGLNGGWVPALNLEDAKQVLFKDYPGISEDDIKELRQTGTWDSFINTGNSMGWD